MKINPSKAFISHQTTQKQEHQKGGHTKSMSCLTKYNTHKKQYTCQQQEKFERQFHNYKNQ
jgi:hypothetical protein